MHIRQKFRSLRKVKHRDASEVLRRAMVAPVVKDTIEWKVTWMETRKAVCIWKEPVPQTDTGR